MEYPQFEWYVLSLESGTLKAGFGSIQEAAQYTEVCPQGKPYVLAPRRNLRQVPGSGKWYDVNSA